MPKPRNRRGKRSEQRHRASKHEHWSVPESAVVRLTPKGKEFLSQLLDAASRELGVVVLPEHLLAALRLTREQTGLKNPRLDDPSVLKCFKMHLAEVARQK